MIALTGTLLATDVRYPVDIQRIKDRGTLVVAQYAGDREPFFVIRPDGPKGFDIDLAQDIARKLGVTVEFLKTARTFNDVVAQVAAGEADIGISELSITTERALSVRYTQPYITMNKGFLINRLLATRSQRGNDPYVLCNHPEARIGVLGGSSHEVSAHEFCPKAQIVTYKDFNDALAAIQQNELLAVVSDDMAIKSLLNANPEIVLKLRMVILKDQKDPIGIITHPDDLQLLSWLNLYLQTSSLQHTTDSLLAEYTEKIGLRN